MQHNDLEDWIRKKAANYGCKLVGFAEINDIVQKEFLKGIEIDGSPAKTAIILGMVLEDPIQDAWTQSPLWSRGKNYIDEALAHVATVLALELAKQGFPSRPLSYGGAYLKHLAVYAGLGIIGRNNLLITPKYGPHIRLRGLLTYASLTPSKLLIGKFAPCAKCPPIPPCIQACPAGALTATSQPKENHSNSKEPHSPRSNYKKETCHNYSLAHLKEIGPFTYLWCRACEEACPIGKENLIKG